MVIAIIRWRIKPGLEIDFENYWITKATIDDKSALVGEFLSSPVPQSELPYKVDDMSSHHGSFVPFVNIGCWESEEAFRDAVSHMFRDDLDPLYFEAERRVRTILMPIEWRVGGGLIPSFSTCD